MSERSSSKSLLKAPARQAASLLGEFRNFAFKGNVVDLAVGVIIGAAFGKIVDSLVKHLIMPLISVVMPSNQTYTAWHWTVNGKEVPYGLLLGEVLNFLIVALVLFVIIAKFLGWLLKSKKQEKAAEPPQPTMDQQLLTEIRDLLKARA